MNTTAATLMVVSGQSLLTHAHRSSFAKALTICGYLWAAQFATYWDFGPLPLIAGICSQTLYLVGAYGIIRYPDDSKPTRLEAGACIYIGISAAIQFFLTVLSSKPTQFHLTDPWWITWDTLNSHREVVLVIATILSLIGPVPFVIAVARRAQRISSMDRSVLLPLASAASFAALATVSLGSDQFFAHPSSGWFFNSAVMALVPFSVLVIFGWQDRVHATIANRLSTEFSQRRLSDLNIVTLLRSELKDESLQIHYWSNVDNDFEGDRGHEDADAKYRKVLYNSDGSPLALVTGSPFLLRHEQIVDTALNTSAVAMENARLNKSLLDQLEEVTESRKRVAQAAIGERQRIERDLHDGVQQNILAVSTRIGTVARISTESVVKEKLESIGEDLWAANQILRDFVHGVLPPELRQFGLAEAIKESSRRSSIPVTCNLIDDRFGSDIEATAYFVFCEALANAQKHSKATQLQVDMNLQHRSLLVSVSDNGNGVIDASGSGLTNLADRVASINGTFRVESLGGRGSKVEATFPCG